MNINYAKKTEMISMFVKLYATGPIFVMCKVISYFHGIYYNLIQNFKTHLLFFRIK